MTPPLAVLALLSLPLVAAARATHAGSFSYSFALGLQPLVALIAGVLILIRPRFLNFIVAVYLIIVGLSGLIHISF